MSFRARLAEAADLPRLQAITRAAYSPYIPELGGPPLPMTDDHAARIAAGQAWMVSRAGPDDASNGGGEPVGVAVLEPAPDHLWIDSLAVDPSAHGGGAGRWMLAFAEERARHLGLPELRLLTNERMTRNIAIYGRAGFIETGRQPNPKRPGWVAVHMRREVGAAK